VKEKAYQFLYKSRIGGTLIAFLVFASLTLFTLETEFQDLKWLRQASYAIACIFALEYFLRIWVADKTKNGRLGYIKSFEGIIDLIAFVPALLFPGAGASVILRALRVARLLQILKIRAFSKGLFRIKRALNECKSELGNECKSELGVSVLISISLIFVGAVLIFFAESRVQPETFGSIPRALWWSMATLTTVGYGDTYPITLFGKVIASAMAMVGIGAVALPAGIIANAFMSESKRLGYIFNLRGIGPCFTDFLPP